MYGKYTVCVLLFASIFVFVPASFVYAVPVDSPDYVSEHDSDNTSPSNDSDIEPDDFKEEEEVPSAGAEDTVEEPADNGDPVSDKNTDDSESFDNQESGENTDENKEDDGEINKENDKEPIESDENENKDADAGQDANVEETASPDDSQVQAMADETGESNNDLFFEKDFSEYTVTEGLLLFIFVVVFCKFCIDMTAKMLHWRMF